MEDCQGNLADEVPVVPGGPPLEGLWVVTELAEDGVVEGDGGEFRSQRQGLRPLGGFAHCGDQTCYGYEQEDEVCGGRVFPSYHFC